MLGYTVNHILKYNSTEKTITKNKISKRLKM